MFPWTNGELSKMSLEEIEERYSPVPCSLNQSPPSTAESPLKSPALESINIDHSCEKIQTDFSFSWKEREDESLPIKNTDSKQHPEPFTATNNAVSKVSENGFIRNSVEKPKSGDVLLRWGKTKRSRAPRPDSRILKARQESKTPGTKVDRADSHQNHRRTAMAEGSALRPRTPAADALGRELEEQPNVWNTTNLPICGWTNERILSLDNPPIAFPPTGHHLSNNQQREWSSPPPCSEPCLRSDQKKRKLSFQSFEWPTFCISLSRKEKQEDFLAIRGTKLPLRPKRRSKIVDRDLQYCFPGMWLCEVSKARYEVREKKCVKRTRGLKGLESTGSDSE